MDIRIDPEFQSFIPHLSDEESAQLEANIIAEGCRDPLVIWQEEHILLDGHNRLRICHAHDLPYQVRELSLPDRYAATVWIINQQLGRRNLTTIQASDLRGQRYKVERLREGSGGIEGNQNAEKPKWQNVTSVFELETEEQTDTPPPGDTAQRIADETGVARRTIFRDAEFSEALDTLSKDVSPTMRQSVTTPPPKEKTSKKKGSSTAKLPRATKQKVVEVARTIKEQQVTLMPFMKRSQWSDRAVLEAISLLGGIPKDEHATINSMLDQDSLPTAFILKVLGNLRKSPLAYRQRIYHLSESTDEREQTLAITMAANDPPNPDPQVVIASGIIRGMEELQKSLNGWQTKWPFEPWTQELTTLQDSMVCLIEAVKTIQHRARLAHDERIESYATVSE